MRDTKLPKDVDEIWWGECMDDIENMILAAIKSRSKKHAESYGLKVMDKYVLVTVRREALQS